MFISVTKKTTTKGVIAYLGIAIFCLIFTRVYESYSFGESSPYMRAMFVAPLIGALVFFLTKFGLTWLRHRLSMLLMNSGIAIIVSACLVKGIVEVSGRTTTVDRPYWYVAAIFIVLSIISGFLVRPKQRKRMRSATSIM